MFGVCRRVGCAVAIALCSLPISILSAETVTLRGTITDPSGAVIRDAKVELLQKQHVVSAARTDSQGEYRLSIIYLDGAALRITAPGFRTELQAIPLSRQPVVVIDAQLALRSLEQQVTVTATGNPTPQGELGAAVTVLDAKDYEGASEMQQALRLVPGVQVTQTGEAGGLTTLSIRGGNGSATKVLIDGIPMNDIGGAVNFANLATAGIGSAEVLRGPNTVLYGPDALAGVISLSTERGSTPFPLLTYLADGGNFGTYHQQGTLGGTYRRFDYFSEYSRFDTANSLPKSEFHNGTYAGNFGWTPTKASSLRITIHHDQIASGQPDALLLYGIPDDAKQANEDAYFGVTFQNQTTPTWHNLLRYGGTRLRSLYTQFDPTGIPQYVDYTSTSAPIYNCDPSSDPNCYLADYLGAPVTIRGANGYVVSGQAVYNYVEPYPSEYPTSTDEDFFFAQSEKTFSHHLAGLAAFQYQNERGYSGGPSESVTRGNYNYTMQLQGDIRSQLFYVVGGGLEDNGLFGFAGVPRASLAYVFHRSAATSAFGSTKLRGSFGEGIEEPSVSDQATSLYALLAGLPNGSQLISQYHVGQIGPEQSRTYDAGVDQEMLGGRGLASVTYFHNEFTHGIEYIPQQGLIDLGVPTPVAVAAIDGATVNSQAYLAQGAEADLQYQASRLFLRGGYTWTDARIQRSFSSDAIGPSYNPDFPGVAIGIDGPLIGGRPFRLAPNSEYFEVGYQQKRLSGSIRGTLVSRRDDSDFLSSDANGGLTLLLPNRDLDPAYQRIDAVVNYQVNHNLALHSSFQNLLSEHYQEAFGYPAAPFMFRSGVQLSFGGEGWPLR